MADVVVTVPKDAWLRWLAEGDLPDGKPGGIFGADAQYDFTVGGGRPSVEPGDRVYIVSWGRVRGYAPLVEVKRVDGRWSLVRAGGAVACTIEEVVPGFRGCRTRWWPREAERPFPAWKTLGVDVRCASTSHRHVEADVWYGGFENGQLFAFGLCAACAMHLPARVAAQGMAFGRDVHVIADLRPAALPMERFRTVLRGFEHGARGDERAPAFAGHAALGPDYDFGFERGAADRADVVAKAATLAMGRRAALLMGWKHGACFSALDPDFTTDAQLAGEYQAGYLAGREARAIVGAAAMQRTGATPMVLRSPAGGAVRSPRDEDRLP